MAKTNKYTAFWLHSGVDILEGSSPEKAFQNAGIGQEALRALDFWARGDVSSEYEFNKDKRSWNKKKEK